MGKLNSIFLRNSKGRLAGTTIYSTGGVTIQREIQTQVRNPRTKAQMKHRVKLGNLVNLYQLMRPFFKSAFENKAPLVSDYNMFVKLNLTDSTVYLTKQQVASGVVLPANYIISQGTLNINATRGGDDSTVFGPAVPSSFSISENTTVAQLSTALIQANPGIKDGMQLSFVRVSFWGGGEANEFLKLEMIINSSNTTDKVKDYFFAGLEAADSRLKFALNDGCSAGAFVLSYTVAGKTYVSTEKLHSNINPDWEGYGGQYVDDAIASYGESEEVFLDSSTAHKA